MWVLGASAMIGNLYVLVWRLRESNETDKSYVQSFLILNLASSDFMMGVFMIIIASADVYYGNEYFKFSEQWRASIVCKVAGFISLISSEASVSFLTIISIDRFISILFPFSTKQLRKKSVRVVCALSWCVLIPMSLVSVVLADSESDFYGLSDVCIGLPLITKPKSYEISTGDVGGTQQSGQTFDVPVPQDHQPAWYFSIALFIGVNSLSFFIIFICYVAIFIQVKLSSKKIRKHSNSRDEEIKRAIKMAIIVGSDFFCWTPIIIMGILSQSGAVVIPVVAYVWAVVFILPINASLNPYLYTLSMVISSRGQPVKKRSAPK